MEENTGAELNKIFGIINSDKNSQKAKQSKENSFQNYKTMNITTDMKNKYNNQKLFNSL